MNSLAFTAILIAAAFIAAAALIRWRRSVKRAKQNREQIDRKLKEDALDRALSNGPRQNSQAKAPVEVRYSVRTQAESSSMIRLTALTESTSKEYLFRRTEAVFLGEEYGRPAVFRERGRNQVDCEIFPHEGALYIHACGKKRDSRLQRGKQKTSLTEKSICLRNGDKIEIHSGTFLVELI